MDRLLLSYPERAGIPNYEEGANTPSGTRPETPTSPSWASRSPERSPHYPLSIQRYAGLFRTRSISLPDSTAQLIRPAGQTHFFPDYPPPITRTSSYTIYLTQSYTVKSHHNTLSCNYPRNYFNFRNKLV